MTFKKLTEKVFRKIGLDPLIYHYVSMKDRKKFSSSNRIFRDSHPELKIPPARLMFDVIACSSAEYYTSTGKVMAMQIHEVMQKWMTSEVEVICEWGAGPGRILFPLANMDTSGKVKFIGTDMYPPSIQWAQSVQVEPINFYLNKMNPPLPIDDGSVDFVYAVSVFTHLSERLTRSWFTEIMRILKPGGVFWFSTHSGQHHLEELNREQVAALSHGDFVAIQSRHNGSQMYTGIHCPKLMKSIIVTAGADLLEYQAEGNQKYQDAWIVQKCFPNSG